MMNKDNFRYKIAKKRYRRNEEKIKAFYETYDFYLQRTGNQQDAIEMFEERWKKALEVHRRQYAFKKELLSGISKQAHAYVFNDAVYGKEGYMKTFESQTEGKTLSSSEMKKVWKSVEVDITHRRLKKLLDGYGTEVFTYEGKKYTLKSAFYYYEIGEISLIMFNKIISKFQIESKNYKREYYDSKEYRKR